MVDFLVKLIISEDQKVVALQLLSRTALRHMRSVENILITWQSKYIVHDNVH